MFSIKKCLLTGLFAGAFLFTYAQTYIPFEQVKKYTRTQPPNKYDSLVKYLTNRLGAEMHYLYPLYQAVGWEDKFKKGMGEKIFYNRFAELLAFAGDYTMASAYQQKSYDTISGRIIQEIEDTISKLRNIQYVQAKDAIISTASHYRAIMIDESHAKSVHRAFTYSLLEDLYKQGYRYLAMEAFNNYSNKYLDSVNVFTGYYVMEPVMGELVRKALQLGYMLISYEDTLATEHTISQRDSVQAVNISNVFKKDPSAKIIVHGGRAHLSEENKNDFKPMAWWFKKINDLDPLTIDQTGMTEGSEFEYGRLFYSYFLKRFNITTPSVIYQNKRPFNPLEEKGYDMIIMSPPTIYQHNRPDWLSLNGERKAILIQPAEKMLFFVQAFYEKEYDSAMINLLVPADQTYITNREGYYCLYLRKGKYKIVMRDVSYKILATKDMEIL